MILVTVGTHEDPFDRLVLAADALAARVAEPVVVQRGYSHVDAPRCRVVDIVAPSEFERLVRDARLVVSHAGLATVDLVLREGKTPIVVPRRPEHGEHVDDDQVRFTARIADRVVVCDDPADLPDLVVALGDRVPAAPSSAGVGWTRADPAALARRFEAAIADLPPNVGLARRVGRATVRGLRRALRTGLRR